MEKLGLSRILPDTDMEITFDKQATPVGMVEKAHMSMWNVSFNTALLLLQVMEAGLIVSKSMYVIITWFMIYIYICIVFYL